MTTLDAGWLRQSCLDAGADDVGFVEIDRPELGDECTDIVRFYLRTRTLISFILRINRGLIRRPARAVANVEFRHTGELFSLVNWNLLPGDLWRANTSLALPLGNGTRRDWCGPGWPRDL